MNILKRVTNTKYHRLISVTSALTLTLVMVWAWAATPPQPQSLWVATELALHQIDPGTHQLTQSISLGDEPEAIAVEPDTGMVWVLGEESLQKYDGFGVLVLDIDLEDINEDLSDPDHLALNPYDGSVWIAASKVLLHLDSNGTSLGSWSLDQKIKALALSPDETLWIVSPTELFQLDETGAIKAQTSLPADLTDIESITIDPLNNKIWVGGETALWQWQSDALSIAPIQVVLPVGTQEVEAIEYDYIEGLLWVATDASIFVYDSLGIVRTELIFSDYDWDEVESLVYSPAEPGVWLGTEKEVIHLSTNGQVLAVIPVASEVEDIAATETVITPVVDITSPANGLLTNNAYLPFVFGLKSTCNAEPCILGEPYWQGLDFDFNLNGVAIGQVITRVDDTATYTPTSRLPEGQNIVTAQVTDAFGHLSDSKTHQFVVDTLPPIFLSVSPADGTLVNTTTIDISGSLDDSSASVMLKDGAGDVLGLQGSVFNFNAGLNEGANSFMLVARDNANNQSYHSLSIVSDTQIPTSPVLSLITFRFLANGDVLVTGATGSAEPGSTIVITNPRTGETFLVVVNADGSFSVIVKAQPGDQLKITSRDAAGNESAVATTEPLSGLIPGNLLGNVFDSKTGAPLANVRILARGLNIEATTDSNGKFVLPAPSRKMIALFFEQDGYIGARRDIYVRPGGTNTVGKVGLTAWDTKVQRITAATGGTYTDSTGNVEVIFPAGALPKDMDIQAAFLPDRESFPVSLPGNIDYVGGVQMGPEHIVFNVPVTIRIRNTFGIPAGTEVPFFFASHDLDDPNESFYDPGVGIVTADGQFIEYQVSHFSCMGLNTPPPYNPWNPEDEDDTGDNDNEDCKDKEDGSSTVSYCEGNVSLRHQLPYFQAFGKNNAPVLTYSGNAANPRPIISTRLNLKLKDDPAPQPRVIRARLTVEGVQKIIYVKPTEVAEKLPLHYSWEPINGSGEKLKTGAYPYVLRRDRPYSISSISTGGGSGGSSISAIRDSGTGGSRNSSRVIVHDRSDSPFGAGWGLEELQRIHKNPDGTLLLTKGSNKATIFKPLLDSADGSTPTTTIGTGFSSPRSIATAPQGGVYISSSGSGNIDHVATDGTISQIASDIPQVTGIGVAKDGTIYAASGDRNIYRVSPGGQPEVIAALSRVDHVDDLAIGPEGNIYVLDGGFGIIHKITPNGDTSFFYNGLENGIGKGFITNGMSMTFDRLGNLYVTSNYNSFRSISCGVSYISKFDRLGNHSYYYVGLNVPRGITADDEGNLFVADYDCDGSSYQIKMITPAGEEFPVAHDISGDVYAFGLAYDLTMTDQGVAMIRPSGDGIYIGAEIPRRDINWTLYKPGLTELSEIRRSSQGNLIRYELNGTGIQHTFSSEGLHLETRHPQGLVWKYEYDSQSRLISRTNAAGHRWSFLYGVNGLSEILDPAGRSVFLTIDANNDLVRVEEPEGASMSYTYYANHKVASKTDSRGNTGIYEYGPLGNLLEARQANGEIRRFDSGRARVAVTAAVADNSSIENPTLLSPQPAEDIYTNGRGFSRRLVTNKYGTGINQIDASGNTTRIERNSSNQKSIITLPTGATITNVFNSNRLIHQSVHSENLSTSYRYDSQLRLTRTYSNFRPDQLFTYDSNYNITSETHGFGDIVINYTYNNYGMPLTSEIDGRVTSYEYDTNGRLTRETNQLQERTEFEYDAAGNLILSRDSLNRETRNEYDALGRTLKIIEPDGKITSFSYEAACATCGTAKHLLTSTTDQLGRIARFEYDRLGQITAEIDPSGNNTTYRYNNNRKLSSITYPNGNTITFEYDAEDRLVRKVLPNDVVTYTYDVMGNKTSVSDNDSTLTFDYDLANRRVGQTTDGLAQAQSSFSQVYNGYDRTSLRTTVGAQTRNISYFIDSLRRTKRIDELASGSMDYVFDAQDRRADFIYSLNNSSKVVSYGYDDASRLLGLGGSGFPGTIDYSYNTFGQLINKSSQIGSNPALSISLDNSSVTTDVLNVTGQVTGSVATLTIAQTPIIINPDGTFQGQVPLTLGYNNIQVVVTDTNGRTSTSSRSVTRISPSTTAQLEQVTAVAGNGDAYVIEDSGSAAVIEASSGSLVRPQWLVAANDISADSTGLVYSTQGTGLWVYNGVDNIVVADLSGLSIQDMEVGPDDQVYLTSGNLIYRIESGQAVEFSTLLGATYLWLDSSSYGLVADTGNAFYRINSDGSSTIILQGSNYGDFAVGPDGEICWDIEGYGCDQLDGSPGRWIGGDSMSVEFDPTGNLYFSTPDNVFRWGSATHTPLLTGSFSEIITGTLIVNAQIISESAQSSYSYDNNDQLTDVKQDGQSTEMFSYDLAGNRKNDSKASDYLYNSINQLMSGNGVTYTYDENGNRTTKTDPTGITTYTWDGENRLIKIEFPDSSLILYAYDPMGRRIQKQHIDQTGAITTRRYIYDNEDILYILDGQNNILTEFSHGTEIDEPISLRRDGTTYNYHADLLGSIVAISDDQGILIQRYSYNAFGEIISVQDPGFIQPYGFTGREFDQESGLYYYRERYYDPVIGKFISKDPIGLEGGDLNFYTYVWNDPVNWIDPYGEAGHTRGSRNSTKGKHQKGNSRRGSDQGGEKADNERRPNRQRPKGRKGPWPPKLPRIPGLPLLLCPLCDLLLDPDVNPKACET